MIGLGLDKMAAVLSRDELEDLEYEEEYGDNVTFLFGGQDAITGY
jgi:hypothetical protein